MSSVFSPPKMDVPRQEPIENIVANDLKKKMKMPTGRSNSMLAGLANALKTRLGE